MGEIPRSLRETLGLGDQTDHEAVRRAIRAECAGNLYTLCKAVLGFRDLTVRTHGPLCQFVQGGASRSLILTPRATFKSSIATVGRIVQRIIQNPDVRILLASASFENASHFLSLIAEQFERNAVFQWLFPELIPDFTKTKRWSAKEMQVPREGRFPEATVEAIGVGGTVVSRHYDHIVNDDLIDEKMAQSEVELRRSIDWYKCQESLLIAPQVGTIQTTGTPWGFHDTYQWIIDHEPGVVVYRRPAINADGTPYFPERLPLPELARLREKYGSFLYSCLYGVEPLDTEGAGFRLQWLRYHRLEGEDVVPEVGPRYKLADCRRLMRVDPAFTEARTAARTAIVVDAVGPTGQKPLLDVWAQRCQPSDMFDAIFALAARWDVDEVGVESVAGQKLMKPFLEAENIRRGTALRIVELRPDTTRSKEARIRAVQPYLERGEVTVDRQQAGFLDEYTHFPFGKTVDILDAWAYGPAMWDEPLGAAEEDHTPPSWWVEQGRSALTGY